MKKEKKKPKADENALLKKGQELLKRYMGALKPHHDRIVENESWYKSRHWDIIRNQKFQGNPEPTTAFVLSTIQSKHADAMDYYPKPNIKPREADDIEEAKKLSEIIPVELEYNDFFDAWSNGWYDKLKHGCAVYANLFDPDGSGGIGSTAIRNVDLLSFYFDPKAKKLSDSKAIFTTELVDREDFSSLYPGVNIETISNFIEPKEYASDLKTNKTEDDRILVVDYYYRAKNENGESVVHLLKFAGDTTLYSSVDDENYKDGYYHLDQYPFELDVMYPDKGNLLGFGMIDVIKSPQIYIDKLDQIIMTNAFKHSRKRLFVSKDAGINIEQLRDPSEDIIECASITENLFREYQVSPTNAEVYMHRARKIEELKETSTANEFSRGETDGGVTAAQAIIALQKASGKTSRSAINQSYSVFSKLIYIDIELKRQFYSVSRNFRIDDSKEKQGFRFVSYSNENLAVKEVSDGRFRKPIFDIKVDPEKKDPFSQASQNEIAKELYNMGFFRMERAKESLIALELMQFDGKDRVVELLKEQMEEMEQLRQRSGDEENQKLRAIVQQMTGENLGIEQEMP